MIANAFAQMVSEKNYAHKGIILDETKDNQAHIDSLVNFATSGTDGHLVLRYEGPTRSRGKVAKSTIVDLICFRVKFFVYYKFSLYITKFICVVQISFV